MSDVIIESLRLENLSYGYHDRECVFEDVTLEIPTGKIVWVSGQSGAGKSVLIKLLNGHIAPTKGRYLINGQDVAQMSFEEFLPYRLRIGYSFDFGGLINNRTIYQNLSLPMEYHHPSQEQNIADQVHEYLAHFNLLDVANERPASIPGAFRKAACVARAFMLNPQMLLLDDPTTGLRSELRMRLKDLLLKKKKSGEVTNIFVASDDTDFINDIADVELRVEKRTARIQVKEVAA